MAKRKKLIDGISKNEKVWLTRVFPNGDVYYITSNSERKLYFLYKDIDGKATRMGKAKTPPELEKRLEADYDKSKI